MNNFANTETLLKTLFGNALVEDVKVLYGRNDRAHQWEHALTVAHNVQQYKEFQALPLGKRQAALFAAMTHDAMLWAGRAVHEITGAGYAYALIQDKAPEVLDAIEVFHAVKEHRASFKGGSRYSIVSELVASADRGHLEFWHDIRRAYYYRLDKIQKAGGTPVKLDMLRDSVEHLREKYGTFEGYGLARAPRLYLQHNDAIVRRFQDDLNREDVMEVILSNKSFMDSLM